MNPGEPTTRPVEVRAVASKACAIPKSISFGPAAPSSTFAGLRSRCSTSTPCTPSSAPASATPSARTAATGSAPDRTTASASDGPGTYSVASHGVGASASASTRCATPGPFTVRAAAISRRNRVRKSASTSRSSRTVFTATIRYGSAVGASARQARCTSPMPPAPIRASSR